MKTKLALLLTIATMFTGSSRANAQSALITWTGNAGYRTQISMTYNSLLSSVFATGSGVFQGPTNQGISSLVVNFYSPSSMQPIFSITDISNGVSMYGFLQINFNTATSSLFGSIDVGKDSFAEGLPGSSAGQYYLSGSVSSPVLMDAGANVQRDSGGSFSVTVVPEPDSGMLLGLAGLVFIAFRSRGRLGFKCAGGKGSCP